MTPFYMTSPDIDLNEAAKCVDILNHTYKIQSGDDDNWSNVRRFINQLKKVGGIKTWNELTIGAQQLVRLF